MALPLRDDVAPRRFPWVTLALILANIVVFLVLQPSAFQSQPEPGTTDPHEAHRMVDAERFANRWAAIPCEVVSGKPVSQHPSACHDRPDGPTPAHKLVFLALLTSIFLHGGVAHIGGNMLFLWVFGNNVEDRLGPVTYLVMYLVGGVVASLGFVLVRPHTAETLVGASGAIAAVMGAYLVFFPRGRILTVVSTAAFQVVYVPAAIVLILFFVTQFMTPGEDIAWQAHVAGMVFGFVAALVLGRMPWIRRRAEADARADAAAASLQPGHAF